MKNGKTPVALAVAGWVLLAAVAAVGLAGCDRAPQAPKAGDVKTITLPGGEKMEMVWCPPGTFLMGNPGEETEEQHEVTLTKGFWLAKYEVTQRQWKSVMGDNPAMFDDDDDKPVERVSLERCREFCRMAGLVLPTEAQWEYACRAGSKGEYGGNGVLDAMGWYDGNSDGETHPVGKKAPNAWGLHDMHGNVDEFCADGYDVYPSHAVTNPVGRPSMLGIVVRGGNWESLASQCRSASRNRTFLISLGHERQGFRPACENPDPVMERAGAPAQGAVAGKTEKRDAGGIAETEGTGRKMELYGMFGVRFGKVMPETEACMTNNVGALAYEYTPENPLEGFGDYVLFATPETRRVSQIRAVRMLGDWMAAYRKPAEELTRFMFDDEEYKRLYGESGDGTEEDVDKVFEDTVRLLERRFKQAGKQPWGEQDKRHFVFANSNAVVVTKLEDRIFIDAVDLGLRSETGREVGERTARQFAGDLRVLALKPEKHEDEELPRLDSVFGVVFGERCRWGSFPEENNTGAWAYTFEPDGRFMGCSDYWVFATAQSRRVFMVRAVFSADTASEAQAQFDQMRRLLEHATGGSFEDEEASGNDQMCRMVLGGRFVIDITKNWLRDLVMLDFLDKELFERNMEEAGN